MRRIILAVALFFGLACVSLADDGTVVAPPAMGSLTVKVGDKEEKIAMQGVKVLDAEGKELTGAARRDALKKDAKIEIVKVDGKVTEIKIKK
jgi:hypothetical protein